MNDFNRSIRALAEAAKARLDQAAVSIVASVAADVIANSPVGDPSLWASPAPAGYEGGTFRANWQHGAGERPVGTLDAKDADGTDTLAAIVDSARSNPRTKHYLSNNLPYALALEYGHSSQAPYGIVGLTALRFGQLVRASVEDA